MSASPDPAAEADARLVALVRRAVREEAVAELAAAERRIALLAAVKSYDDFDAAQAAAGPLWRLLQRAIRDELLELVKLLAAADPTPWATVRWRYGHLYPQQPPAEP